LFRGGALHGLSAQSGRCERPGQYRHRLAVGNPGRHQIGLPIGLRLIAGEDFAFYGPVEPRIRICMFRLGTSEGEALRQSERNGNPPLAVHSNRYAPVRGATIRTGVTAITAAVIDLVWQGRRR